MGIFSFLKSEKHQVADNQANEKERQAYILKITAEEVAIAIKIAQKHYGNGEATYLRDWKVPFWKEHSVVSVMYYEKLKDQQSAQEADIVYFHKAIEELRDLYPDWNLMVTYPSSGEKVPDKILIQKK